MDTSAIIRTAIDLMSASIAVGLYGKTLAKKTNETLGQLYDIAIGHKVYYWSEKKKKILEKNTAYIIENLKDADPSKLAPIRPELGVPIVEKLSYIEAPEIAKLFASLLAKSAHVDHIATVHPRYINIINNLSVDDARIVEYIYHDSKGVFAYPLPYIRIYAENRTNPLDRLEHSERLTAISTKVDLLFPEADVLYIENLVSQEILSIVEKPLLYDNAYIEPLKLYQEFLDELNHNATDEYTIKIEYGDYRLTYWGKAFIKTCFIKINDAIKDSQ